ncbi:MAG: DHA2 family efflux MFS transporter permease subunit [Aquificaceae bacterium]|jgi:DHA2 family multidrug resistance protein|uniref:DHA2 family efflux MFS transporter permease subunit n=1 Tax=Hydrogenobacter sp. Uz 6-8 TaxID=3384828 RepID=UPI000F18CB19|nr:MAG: DHA2 family efflux MFS transporter permease subunit [Aquificota bacterium]
MREEKPFHEALTPPERAVLTLSLMIGVFMAILDTTIVDIVVPKMMAPLSTDLYGVQWVITSYMTSAATAILLVEWLESRVGLKRVFLAGLFLFTTASFFCGQAQSLEWMIASRTVQGFGESLIVVSAEALLFSAYAPEKRGLAMGIYGLGVSFAPALGPTLGGWITEHIDWRWIFYINLPIGILNFTLALFFLKDYRPIHRLRLNFLSYLLISLATVSLLVVLSRGQKEGWFASDFILHLSLLSLFSFLLFLLSELTSRNKLIDPSIFRIKEFVVAFWVYCFVLGFSMYQVFYLIPLYFEKLKGYTTLQAGLAILPMALTIGFLSPVAGIISDKKSPRFALYVATVLYLSVAFLLLPRLNYFTPGSTAVLYLVAMGAGMGFFFAPVTQMALKRLGEKTTLGVSLMHYIRFVGGSFGTALATNDLQRFAAENLQRSTELQNPYWLQMKIKEAADFIYQFSHQAEERAKAMLYQLQSLYAMSDAFGSTLLLAAFWALLGSLPVLYLFWEDIRDLLSHGLTKEVAEKSQEV